MGTASRRRAARVGSRLGCVVLPSKGAAQADALRLGRVYRIPEELGATIWPYLDHREKDGYTMRTVDVWGVRDGQEVVIEQGVRASPLPAVKLL